jgi:hypothetical protein
MMFDSRSFYGSMFLMYKKHTHVTHHFVNKIKPQKHISTKDIKHVLFVYMKTGEITRSQNQSINKNRMCDIKSVWNKMWILHFQTKYVNGGKCVCCDYIHKHTK